MASGHAGINVAIGVRGIDRAFNGLLLPCTLAGGGVRWYMLNKIVSMQPEILVLIVFDRMINTVFMVALGLFFLLDDAVGGQRRLGIDLAIACGALFSIYLLAFGGRVTRFALSVLLALGCSLLIFASTVILALGGAEVAIFWGRLAKKR